MNPFHHKGMYAYMYTYIQHKHKNNKFMLAAYLSTVHKNISSIFDARFIIIMDYISDC